MVLDYSSENNSVMSLKQKLPKIKVKVSQWNMEKVQTSVLRLMVKGDAMSLTLLFQNNMLVVGLRFSYNPMDDNYFL